MKFNRFSAVVLLGICMMPLPMTTLAAYNTSAASEEYPPAVCNYGNPVIGATCTGSYCDNTYLSCDNNKSYPVYNRYWSGNFSEETNGNNINHWDCGDGWIMTGISCAGSYCDNNSIECSYIGKKRSGCQWIGPYSEEQGPASFGGYASGMWCTGSNCDNHYYLVCTFEQ